LVTANLKSLMRDHESGQAMIMFAVLAATLLLTMAVAIEGGRVFVEYRHMQSAADVAALVGAQDLPCDTSAAGCITTAETDACTYAGDNGYGGCVAGGTGAPTANVPPLTCSPYSFIDYGNNASNPCPNATGRTSNTPVSYAYIEVELNKTLTIPVFGTTITLYTHSIARKGTNGRGDYAVSVLDPSVGSFDMGGSAQVNVEGSTFTNGTITVNGNPSLETCGGGWLVSGNELTPPGPLTTYSDPSNAGTPGYAPPGCYSTYPALATADPTPNWAYNQHPITDPYADSAEPPYLPAMGTWPNCTACQAPGIYFDLGAKTWHQAPSGATSIISGGKSAVTIEMFPGVYDSLALGVGDEAILNPGVYTFNTFNPQHGRYCVYGSPACDTSNNSTNLNFCATTNFAPNSVAGNQWYHGCSPWGFWDPTNFTDKNTITRDLLYPSVCSTCAPTFYDGATGLNSTVPLNGVTIHLLQGIKQTGNAGDKTGDLDQLAFPNPCPGNGAGSSSAVDFKAGTENPAAVFSFTAGQDWLHGSVTQSPAPGGITYAGVKYGGVYPNADLSLVEDTTLETENPPGCAPDTLLAWPKEFGGIKGQHLHFLFWARGAAAAPDSSFDETFNGAAAENFTGIFYIPKATLTVLGAGKGLNGTPWIYGQVVAWDVKWSGNGSIDVVYRPCQPGSTPCGTGPGTSLIQ
jgi:Flp pilus assembly protein TadG